MVSITPLWLLILLTVVVAALIIAHRLGAASMRVTVAELRGQCRTLTEQLHERGEIDATLQPLQQAMSALQQRVDQAEVSRTTTLTRLSENVLTVGRQVNEATRDVQEQAHRITQALSRTQNQGSWGEMQLRRLVEASGMLEHVHFVEQLSMTDDDALLRPDMVIDLGGGRKVVVDAKVSLDAFLDPEADPQVQAQTHAAAVADHVNRLASKQYWRAVDTPEFVIMFLPAEHMLGVALQARPDLLQVAFDKKIVLATPTTLMATLRSISWAWQQAAMAQEAREVLAAGRQVHDRLSVMGGHIARLGKHLGDAVTGYNQFVGSFDSRVMPSARRLAQLAAPEAQVIELPEVDVRPRRGVSMDDPSVTRDTG